MQEIKNIEESLESQRKNTGASQR